jgi:hypothetical protein
MCVVCVVCSDGVVVVCGVRCGGEVRCGCGVVWGLWCGCWGVLWSVIWRYHSTKQIESNLQYFF